MKARKYLLPIGISLVAAFTVFTATSPSIAQDVARIRTEIRQELHKLGLIDSPGGTNAAALGPSSSVDSYVSVFSGTSGKLLDDRPVTFSSTGQQSWPTGLGALTHILGPTDQALVANTANANGIILRQGGNTRVSVLGAEVRITGVPLAPAVADAQDLGSSSTKWRYVYAAGGIAPSVLHKSVTSAQTGANTNETTLWSYSLPAGTLASDGQAVRIRAWGTTAANANNKTVRLYFGSTPVAFRIAQADNNIVWQVDAVVLRTGATTQLATAQYRFGTHATFTGTAHATFRTTPAETLSGAVTIAVKATNGAANAGDIVFDAALVEFKP